MRRILLLPVALLACRGEPEPVDNDGDGALAAADCNDADANIHPDATELCNGVDDDCSGQIDDAATDASTFYRDGDADGYGDSGATTTACDAPEGYVTDATDCDDTDGDFHPGAPETDCTDPTDYNCDGSNGFADADADGFPACEDCDDTAKAVNPSATEACDGIDNDCDGSSDEPGATGEETFYRDADGDSYGTASDSKRGCSAPAGYVSSATDCNDASAAAYPGGVETCDGLDNDCNGQKDDGATDAKTWYADGDADGYGNASLNQTACNKPAGFVEDATDCDDANKKTYPGATETCDTKDNNCDDAIDEGFDADADGYTSCGGDCDDTSAAIKPGASEVCDDKDNDCDGAKDEDATDPKTWYLDYDKDGYGSDAVTLSQCAKPTGFVDNKDDCDDLDKKYNPGAAEGCDGEDYDCDGAVDHDADGDSYADIACGGDDCDDSDKGVKPEVGGGCALGKSCNDIVDGPNDVGDGTYTIDPDGFGTGQAPMDVYCDMTSDGGGWTLCASLTKGYVPADMLHKADAYAFQARLKKNNNFVFNRDAPARFTTTWDKSEEQNYGQFCRLMGAVSPKHTKVQQKTWNASNNFGASQKNQNYHLTKSGVYTENLFTQWFTNSSSGRVFTRISGDQLSVSSNSNGYGGVYTTPNVSWSGSGPPYTHSSNPWGGVDSSVKCVGCTNSSSGYDSLPYGQVTILNNMSHSYWLGIPNIPWGWSDCTANGDCNYHESGYGVWLFWVR